MYICSPPRSIWEDVSSPVFSNPKNSSFGGGLASCKFLLKSNWELSRNPGNLESWSSSFGGGFCLYTIFLKSNYEKNEKSWNPGILVLEVALLYKTCFRALIFGAKRILALEVAFI